MKQVRTKSTVLYRSRCRQALRKLKEGSVDAVVTDPPYALGFMNKAWDKELPTIKDWTAILRVLKPGGYLLAFGGTRTYHRLACTVEDAGFEIRDCLMWIYGSGFPKGKGCLKPAWEPILLARKPGAKVLPLGVDKCRVKGIMDGTWGDSQHPEKHIAIPGSNGKTLNKNWKRAAASRKHSAGRWPANVVHDGSEEVIEAFAAFGECGGSGKGGLVEYSQPDIRGDNFNRANGRQKKLGMSFGDTGTAARFFYCAKASRRERGKGNKHPSVKPLALMKWLIRLIAPKDATVLDPFMGSGSTGVACAQTGRKFIGIEKKKGEGYFETAVNRIDKAERRAGFFPS